jgi:hypothetical protein
MGTGLDVLPLAVGQRQASTHRQLTRRDEVEGQRESCLGAVSRQKVALGLVPKSPCKESPDDKKYGKSRVYDGVGRLVGWFRHGKRSAILDVEILTGATIEMW